MLIKFIIDNLDFNKVLSGRENKNAVILKRENGFFVNRAVIMEHGIKVSEGYYRVNPNDDTIIYTDDETMLHYASYIDGKYAIEFKFPESNKFISISELHPNLRRENNLTVMYQKGIFLDDFYERFNKEDFE